MMGRLGHVNVPTVDSVLVAPCDDCPLARVCAVIVADSMIRVHVLEGCDVCAGSRLTLASR